MSKAGKVGLIVVIIAIVVVVTALSFLFLNNKQVKTNAGTFLNTKLNIGAINLNKMDKQTAGQPVQFTRTESASSSTLKVLHISFEQFQDAISKVTYQDLKNASVTKGSDKDIFTLANQAITTFHLNEPKVSPKSVNLQTFTSLIDVMNVLTTVPDKTTGDLKTLKDSYVKKFKALIKKA